MANKRELIKAITAAEESTIEKLEDQYEDVKRAWASEQIEIILDGITEEQYREAMEPLRLMSVEVIKRVNDLNEAEGCGVNRFMAHSILNDKDLHAKWTLRENMLNSAEYGSFYYINELKGYQAIERELKAKTAKVAGQFSAIRGNCSRMKSKEIEEYLTGLGLDWIIEEHKTQEVKYEVMAPIDVKLINQLRADKL